MVTNAPVIDIDREAFWHDPYPTLAHLRASAPVAYVPQLNATLLTRRGDIWTCEKNTAVFSSEQPEGLMTRLMGQNMMRKDGAAHQAERAAIFPSTSPRTVRDIWLAQFQAAATSILDALAPQGRADLVSDYALPLAAEALKAITGLTNMSAAEMDRVSQGMIDGCANYAGDPQVEAHCHACTASIDRHIDARIAEIDARPDASLLSVQRRAGLEDAQVRANIKLAISGGQNEPRDAIAGTIWALLTHPEALNAIQTGHATWRDGFEEYARWISPIGMSPRRIAQPFTLHGTTLEPGDMAFLMFGAANRDPACFADPERFDLTQNRSKSIPFGAGPHFCAGAWAARALIAEVALPMAFARLPRLRLDPDHAAVFGGWAFRGPLSIHVQWDAP
ncbi:cytochrome P450 [Pararhodobacter oceanensis]|uniref:Cytochrome P450 n=1 Tax=Pararhodobacter oceanensis TaxID=2172121 RepID=A0A2T8HU92_9RHOB|nr:cytochrome P450 [Pararhodobacter oceanensis]PVH28963.1 cytochrome P450 [Pararhodobacter oceanensis]